VFSESPDQNHCDLTALGEDTVPMDGYSSPMAPPPKRSFCLAAEVTMVRSIIYSSAWSIPLLPTIADVILQKIKEKAHDFSRGGMSSED
jgi:hypothetical protein